MSQSEVYSWIEEMKWRKTDFNTIPSPVRVSDKSFTNIIVHRFKQDHCLSTRKLAESLDIVSTTMSHYLQDIIGMKYLCLRWVIHVLN
jgi:hypothetical protein